MIGVNEAVLHEDGRWLHFHRPHRIVEATRLSEVMPALRDVERAVEANGWHAAGFISYEAAPAFDTALDVRRDEGFPYVWFGLYPPPDVIPLPPPGAGSVPGEWQPTVTRKEYDDAIARVKDDIARGMTYQVNYTMRLRSAFDADPWPLFLGMARAQEAGHAACIDTGRWFIASASPELFFRLDGRAITCRPMKGTAPRGRTNAEDAARAEWLRDSVKNRAENVMVVDMIRNDLGRIAETGSVRVTGLYATERYATLWQMTSGVTALTDAPLADIVASLFPCASVTGAPKVSTMRIIAELETTPRRIYTGGIGHVAPGRNARFGVAIRTVLIDRMAGQAEYGVGGGVVWDSTPADEYAEALLKARVLTAPPPEFSLLETLLWTPSDGWVLGERHIARLLDSAEYFGFPASRGTLEAFLGQLASTFDAPRRVRILLGRDGTLEGQSTPHRHTTGAKPLRVRLAAQPVRSDDVFLCHKTTHRGVYEAARAARPKCDDVLLHNERGELTEFTIGNLVVEMDGGLWTPPLTSGLLPGTFRQELLATGKVRERVIRVDDLPRCGAVFLVNSVVGWRTVTLAKR